MSPQDEDFLSRWSRRKLAAGQGDKAQPVVPGQDAEAEKSGKVGDEGSSEPALSPEEIAALPKIEDLTPESDITVFFRKGVPEALKNAALRRIWALDPTILNYVGDARDYAYDWNIPGGVPGNGPLLPTDDIGAMLQEVFRDGPAEAEPLLDRGKTPEDNQLMNVINASQHADAPPGESQAITDKTGTAWTGAGQLSGQPDSASQFDCPPASAPPRSGRRHGGAKPV